MTSLSNACELETGDDVPRLRAVQQRLGDALQQLRLAVDAGQMGAFDWDVNTGQIDWTDYHYTIFGYRPGSVSVTLDFWSSHVQPEDLEKVITASEASKRDKTFWSSEYRIRRADGQIRWISVRGHFVYDKMGVATRGRGVVFDITESKTREYALEESEARFRFVVESIPHMVWSAAPDGSSIYYNQRFLNYLGLTLEQMQGWTWLSTLHPEDQQSAREAWERAFKNATEYRIELRIKKGASGLYRWFDVHALPRKDHDGRIVSWYGTCTDIHDRKAAQQALHQSETLARARLAELQGLYGTAPVGLGFIDRDYRYVRVNDALAKINGVSVEAHVGRTVLEIVGPEIWSRVEPVYRQVMGGQSLVNTEVKGTLPSEPNAPRCWLVSYHPVRTASKEIIGVGIAVQDVTEQRKAEVALRRYELLAGRTRDIILFIERGSGKILEANAAAVRAYGYTREELLSLTVYDLRAPGARQNLQAEMAQAEAGGLLFETVHQRKDGSTLAVEVSSSGAVLDNQPMLLSIIRDITERKHVEELLHRQHNELKSARSRAENEQRLLEAVMEALPVGVAITDQQGGVQRTNAAFERLWGRTPPPAREVADYASYKAWWAESGQVVAPEDWAAAIAVRQGRPALGQLLEIQRFDGTRGFVLNSASPIRDVENRVVGSAVGILDITELRTAQEALRRSEDRFRKVFEHAATGIAISDGKGHFVQCNEAFAAIVGYSTSELEQRSFLDLVHPEDREANAREVHRLCAGQFPFFEIENRYVHRNGQHVWVRSFVSVLREEAGHPCQLLALVTNTTDRKQAEEALRQSEARLQLAKGAARLGIHDWDIPNGTVAWDEHTRELWGVGSEVPITYEVFMDGIHPEDRASTQQRVDQALDPKNDGRYYAEFRVTHAIDRITRWIAATGQVTFENGRAVRMVGTVQNITQRRAFQAEMERQVADRTKSLQETTDQLNAFCYSIAHDLKAPIRSQVAFANLLMEDFGSRLDAEVVDYVVRMRKAAERQARLVDDLLSHMRLNRADIPIEPVDLTQIVETACSDLQTEILAKKAALRIERVSGKVLANSASLQLVLTNLISNAVKFVRPELAPQLSIWTEPIGSGQDIFLRLSVQDNGIGIPARSLDRIFGVFERLHSAERYPGTGIGLAIVKKAVERMGGRVGVESQEGVGSRFWVELPVARP